MRIFHLLNSLGEANGIVNMVTDLAIEQVRLGHQVTVVSKDGERARTLRAHGVGTEPIDFTRGLHLPNSRLRLRRAILHHQPHVVHVHTVTPYLLLRTIRRRTLTVATIHNEWQRHANLLRTADIVVGVSEAVTAAMIARGLDSRRARTVLNGTLGSVRSISRASTHDTWSPERPALLSVGSVSHRKGSDLLLKAFTRIAEVHEDAELWVVGNVDWKEFDIEAELTGHANRIHYVGVADPWPYYRGATLFLMPSRNEPFGLVAAEAQSCGLPVISFRVGGIPEVVRDGVSGVLSDPEDWQSMAKHSLRLLENESLRLQMSRAASLNADRLSTRRMASEYLDLYNSRVVVNA